MTVRQKLTDNMTLIYNQNDLGHITDIEMQEHFAGSVFCSITAAFGGYKKDRLIEILTELSELFEEVLY